MPIAIATIISKLFEQVILINIKNFLNTTDNQFGFKTKHSTDMCVFLLKQTISYYITRGSPIFCVFLDASNAFKRVNHYLLFQKLIVRNVPMCFVCLLIYWYTQQSMQIRWVRCYSSLFSVTNGVRQASILSPYFFAIYIDDLPKERNKIKVGCFVGKSLVNHSLFADDLCCFCPSIHGLQRIIDVCHSYVSSHNIIFNCQKTLGLFFASSNFRLNVKPNVVLGDFKIQFVNEIKYLGVFLNSKLCDDDDINRQVRYLYGTANRLKTCFYKCSTKIKNVLFRTYCSSMYACQLWNNFLSSSLKIIRVAYNNSFRFLHGLPRYVSARKQQVLNNITTFDAILRKLSCFFVYRCYDSNNKLIFSLMTSEFSIL